MVPLSTLPSNRSLVNDVIVVIPSGMGPVTPQFSTSRLVSAVNCDRMGGMGAFKQRGAAIRDYHIHAPIATVDSIPRDPPRRTGIRISGPAKDRAPAVGGLQFLHDSQVGGAEVGQRTGAGCGGGYEQRQERRIKQTSGQFSHIDLLLRGDLNKRINN